MNTESVLPILGELFAKSVLITLAAVLVTRAWRGATAAQRHLVWLVALVTVMMLPLTRLVTPFWRIPLNPPKPVSVVKVEPLIVPTVPVGMELPMERAIPVDPVHPPLDWRKILLGTWLSGAALLLGYRLFGSWRLHRLMRRSTLAYDPRIRILLSRTLSELHLQRRPGIRLSEECRVPITWGSLRPVMLLPKTALEWSDTWILAALRHEAAHIYRYDYLTRWFAQVACALYWPNPLVWLLARSLRVAQELAADDLVLRAGTPADEYASQLVEAAREITTHGFFVRQAVAMACPSTLEDRVRAIVDGRRDRRPLSRLAATCGSFAIASVLALSTAAQLRSDEQKPAPGTEEAKSSPQHIAAAPKGADAATPDRSDVVIALDKAGHLKLNGESVTLEDLKRRLKALKAGSPDASVILRPAAEMPYKDVMALLDEIQKAGITNVGLVSPAAQEGATATLTVMGHNILTGGTLALDKNGEVAGRTVAVGTGLVNVANADTDAVFLRGLYFDLTGHAPTPEEVRAFLDDPRPSAEKRKAILDQLANASDGEALRRMFLDLSDRSPTPEELRAFGGDALFQSRTYLDLTGRQPTPEEQRAFLKDPRPSAEKRKALVEKLAPSGGDAEFLRRVYLDIIGRTPTPGELRSFFDDPRPSAEKRKAVIEKLAPARGASRPARTAPVALDNQDQERAATTSSAAITGPNSLALNGNITFTQSGTIDEQPKAGKAELFTKEWKIPPHLIPMKPDGSGPESARDWLTSRGIVFEGAAAASAPRPLHLVVRNTQAQLDLIDQLIIAWNETHPAAAEEARPAAPENPVLAKAEKIIIPKLEMREATFDEALQLLRKKAVEFDPDKKGVKIVVKPGFVPNPDVRITVSLTNIPLIEAMKYVTGLADVGFVATADALMVQPASGPAPGAGEAPPRIPGLDPVPLPPPGAAAAPQPPKIETEVTAESPALKKANEIIIPNLEFREATLDEAIAFLRVKAKELDPDKTGINIVVKPGGNSDARITISLTNIPLIEALHYVAELAGLRMKAEKNAVVLGPPGAASATSPKVEPAPENLKPDQAHITPAKKPVELQADNVRMENGVATAEGHAQLAFGKYAATADEIHYHPDTRGADLIGHVEVKDGLNLVQAEGISVNLDTGTTKIQGPHRTSILPPNPPVPGDGK